MEGHLISKLHCALCANFLSVSPILIDTNGKNICGRCKSDVSADLLLHNIHYEKLVQQFVFPCRFTKEGCSVKILFKNIKNHEETCPYQSIKCGLKTCEWSGIPTELIIHNNKHHQELVIENYRLERNLSEGEGYFILATQEFYFLIDWSYYESKFKLKVKNLHLLDLDCDNMFNYSLSTLNSKASGSLKLNNSITLFLQDFSKKELPASTSLFFSIDAVLSANAINKKVETLNSITCPNCSYTMTPPILKCPVGHITCVDCSDTDYDFCKQCADDELRFNRVRELEVLATSLLYKCKWKNCDEAFSIKKIECHQRTCSKRIYMCLHCPIWTGLLNEMSEHIPVCTSPDYIYPMFTDTEITVLGTNIGELEYSLIAHKELFHVFFNRCERGIEVAVCNCGPPSLFGWYSYEAELQHTEDLNCSFNRTYSIENKSSNRFTETLESWQLKALKCVICKKFLSVHLVLIDQDGKNICGRCESDISDDIKYVHNISYENLAQQFRFPCSFIKEGCSVKKKFNEMKVHEETCPYQIVKCQVKKCEWSGNAIELIIHYDENHQELIVQNNCAKELQEEDCCFMHIVEGFCFLLKWEFHEHKFNLKVKSLSSLDSFNDVEFHINLFTVDPKFPLNISNSATINASVTIDMQDFQKSLSNLPIFFSINTSLSADVINKMKEELKKIICGFCKHQMVPPILKCRLGHITCIDCTTPYFDTCEGCDTDDLRFTRVVELELITEFFQYTCKWKNCNQNFGVREIRAHEHNCLKRVYECRHCVNWTGFINEILSHDAVCTHRNLPRCMSMDTQVTVLGTDIKENINEKVNYWLIAFNEYFEVDFEPLAEGIDVMVSNYGLPSLFGWYCYEVDLQHVEEPNYQFNKTYLIRNKSSNVYICLIPTTDTIKFGGPEFYKITVRIRLLSDF